MRNHKHTIKNSILTTAKQQDCCSTTLAGKLLGLSVGTVQNLVETKKLIAWKTEGGHRRILMSSILEYQKLTGRDFVINDPEESNVLLIVEDDVNTRKMYEAYFNEWDLGLVVLLYPSAIETLLDLHSLRPKMILTDLKMSNMDGFKFIEAIRKNDLYSNLPIIAMTGMTNEEIREHGGLDDDVFILNKPIDMVWLKGFLQGVFSLNK